MNKSIRTFGVLSVLSLALPAAFGSFTPSSGEIKVGEWNNRVIDIIDKADKENVPVVMVGTAFGCAFCGNFESTVMANSQFKQWVANAPYLFCFCYDPSGWWTVPDSKKFIEITGSGAMPRIGGYWKKKDGTVVGGQSVTFAGRGYSWNYYTQFWDTLFKDYDPNTIDAWDHGDDQQSGATVLEPLETESVTPLHYLSAAISPADKEDWFKMTLKTETQYRLYFDLSTYEGVVPKVQVLGPGGVIKEATFASGFDAASPFVFTPAVAGDYYVRCYIEGNSGKGTYKLAYRAYEDVTFSLDQSEVTVDENAGALKVKLLREGRLTDAVAARVATVDGTAKAGKNYTKFEQDVTVAAGKESAEITVRIIDIAGFQGDTKFALTFVNPENEDNAGALAVTIRDMDWPTDAKDPGDDVRAGATVFQMKDDSQGIKAIEGGSRVVSGMDLTDWFDFGAMKKDHVYQVKVASCAKRPASADETPDVKLYSGSATSEFVSLKLTAGEYVRFTATEDANLVACVVNGVAGGSEESTVYTYDLEWREWVLPVVEFAAAEVETASQLGVRVNYPVTLRRSKNLEEPTTVRVEVMSEDGRVISTTNSVSFAVDESEVTFKIPIEGDDGLWAPDAQVTVTVLVDPKDPVVQVPDGAIMTQTITLHTSTPEFDEKDGTGDPDANATPATATVLPVEEATGKVSKRPTTIAGLTLNGTDAADYYSFPVEAGVEYGVDFDSIRPLTLLVQGDETLKVTVTAPGLGEKTVPMTEIAVGVYRFTPTENGTAVVGVTRIADEPKGISYELRYREWVPATIALQSDAVTVSEFASSVRIPVRCDMDVPILTGVQVKTSDGTAKAGEDYVALDEAVAWTELSPTSSVQYVTVDLIKLVEQYEGASEYFNLYLDFANSDALPGAITNLTVTIKEGDKGAIGTFAIGGFQLDGEERPYQAQAVSVPAGKTVSVRIIRTGGFAGVVTATLTWKDGSGSYPVTFGDLEVEKWVDVQVPDSIGAYVGRQSKQLVLTTDNKSAKTTKATMNFLVTDTDQTLSAYGADRANVPFTSGGNAWYQSQDGLLRSKALAASGQSAAMSATLKGEGTLTFKPTVSGNGTLVVRVAGQEAVLADLGDGVKGVSIPNRTVNVTFTFTAAEAGAWMSLDEVAFTPGVTFLRTGTFNGCAVMDGVVGRSTFTVAANGRASGRLTLPGNKVWSITGNLSDGSSSAVRIQKGLERSDAAQLAVSELGALDFTVNDSGIAAEAAGWRDGWRDRPLTGVFAEKFGLLGQTIPYEDAALGLSIALKISGNGVAYVSGRVGNRSVSASATVYQTEANGLRVAFLLTGLDDGVVLELVEDDAGHWTAVKADVL